MDYATLEKLPPEKYLDWEYFKTEHDGLPINNNLAREQYAKGLKRGKEAIEIHLSTTGVWSTYNKDNSHTSSYEGIGYHAGTKDLLHGFLDSGAPIIVHRWVMVDGQWHLYHKHIKC